MNLRRKLIRSSSDYAIGSLLAGGLGLTLAPQTTLNLLQSDGDWGDVMPRLAGILFVMLALPVAQIVRMQVEQL